MTTALDRQLKDLYPELLTAHEVALLLDTTRTTVNNLRKRGDLGGIITPNGNVFFLKHEVEALKLRRKLKPPKIGRPKKTPAVATMNRKPLSVHPESTQQIAVGANR